MSYAYVKIQINPTTSINNYTRLLRMLSESEVMEDIEFIVD